VEFIEAHKRLEKLCEDVMNAERGIKAYYTEMERLPRGEYLISGWKADLKNLKHYNWVRNQIAHEPGCTEENMCQPVDTLWLEDFYRRIMNQTDPLSLLRKATQPRVNRPIQQPARMQQPAWTQQPIQPQKPIQAKTRKNLGCGHIFFVAVIVVSLAIIVWKYIF
jgi:hypothetical protein